MAGFAISMVYISMRKGNAMWQLQQLRHFVAIYEQGSVSAAARQLGLSQPALSRSMQRLEDAVGLVLFQRDTHHLRPTDFAQSLYRQANRILQESAGLDRMVGRHREGKAGVISIGCGPFVPDILMQMLSGPNVLAQGQRLDIQGGEFHTLQKGLYAYRHDFMVYDLRLRQRLPDQDDLVTHPLLALPLRVVASPKIMAASAVAGSDEQALKTLAFEQRWALPRVSRNYRRETATWLTALMNERGGPDYQLDTISSCLALCREGKALTLAPDSMIAGDVASGALCVLPLDAGVDAQPSMYRLRSHPLSEPAARVWQFLASSQT